MGEITIRNVTVDDAEALCILCREAMGYTCDPSLVKEKIEKLDPRREAVFIASSGSSLAGFVHVEIYDVLYFETMANILGLAVGADFRKNGIGKKLLLAAEEWATQKGIRQMRLNSGMSRTDAHGFYRHLGYTDEKDQKRFVKVLKREV